MEVVGIDISPAAIQRAQEKALARGLDVVFQVADVLDPPPRRFATVIDSGVFHVFSDLERGRYVRSLGRVLEPGGVLFVLAFSEHTPGTEGPRRVTQAEFHDAFAEGWIVDRIEASEFEVREDYQIPPARAWLAKIVRTAGLGLGEELG
jgi:SAM-dependent methyltransferase